MQDINKILLRASLFAAIEAW